MKPEIVLLAVSSLLATTSGFQSNYLTLVQPTKNSKLSLVSNSKGFNHVGNSHTTSLFESTASSETTPEESSEPVSPTKAIAVSGGEDSKSGLKQTLKVGFLFGLWYTLNIGYNIYNKKALNIVSMPYIVACVQLLVGLAYVIPLWVLGIRKAPKLNQAQLMTILPIAFCHMAGHLSAVIGLGAGAVSFVQIVKAMEPFFTAVFTALFIKEFFAAPVYAALIPVVAGVGLASLKELSFTWLAFGGAMISNVAFATRAILSKKSMDQPKGENMNAPNLYAVLTILAFLMTVPVSLAVEGPNFTSLWNAAIEAGATKNEILKYVGLSGFFFYAYNEVAFLTLNEVHPVTHAVGNTLKRVAIIIASVIVFKTPLTPLGIVGSAIAIGGVLLYSLLKNYYASKEKK